VLDTFKKNSINGFTLVELLVVLAIIAFLAFVIMSATERAQLTSCETTSAQIKTQKQSWDAETDKSTPQAKRLCEKLNKSIDQFNDNECAELLTEKSGLEVKPFKKEECPP